MDFGTILNKAQKNDNTTNKEIKYYSTKFEPPKKVQRNKPNSANIQKFLARKEEEEKKKADAARKERDQLLELRSKDKKATRRVNVMLKRTKSANQSVIQDAVDNDNTAVTLVGANSQPDEDDYGYVSQSAAAYYTKMMEKYSKMPDEPKFKLAKKKVSTNLSGTKERVKAALEKEKEEAAQPHKRRRKHHGESSSSTAVAEVVEEEKEEEKKIIEEKPKKPKFRPAPVLNFADLLKIAEKKQFEPIKIEKKEEVDTRLFTKKQRREYLIQKEIMESKERRERERENPSLNKIPKLSDNKIPKMNGLSDRIPKANGSSRPVDNAKAGNSSQTKCDDKNRINESLKKSSSVTDTHKNKTTGSTNAKYDERNKQSDNKNKPRAPERPSLSSNKTSSSQHMNRNGDKTKISEKPSLNNLPSKSKQFPPKDLKPKQLPPSDLKTKQYLPNDLRSKQFPPSDIKSKQNLPNDVRSKQFPPRDTPKQFPPKDVRSKPFPPKDVRPKQFPPNDVRSKRDDGRRSNGVKMKPGMINKGRIYDDDEDEYDSEMDDFIDDGDDDENDYSKHISEIFGYDKRKWRDIDEDDDNMETSFAAQMKEEVISTKLGIKEDMEELKAEEAHRKKKAMMKKKTTR